MGEKKHIYDETSVSPGLAPAREYIIIVFCLKNTVHGTSIRYAAESGRDIYVISRVPTFYAYLEQLFRQMASLPNVKIALVSHDTAILSAVLRLLIKASDPVKAQERRTEYIAQFREHLVTMSGNGRSPVPDLQVALPMGHADRTPSFDVAIIHNSDEIDESNFLCENHAATQQILRLIALKHGARFGALSGLGLLVSNPGSMVLAINQLYLNILGLESVIFKPEGLPVVESLMVHQYVPVGWDSWNKIMLVARSIPRFSEMGKLLGAEVEVAEFNDAYDDWLEAEEDTEWGQSITLEPDVENGAFARLSGFFPAEQQTRLAPEKPHLSMTYDQFIRELLAQQSAR